MDAIVGAQVERIADGDIAGWAALTCSAPAAEQWLVGGSTALGSSARLVLTNPSTAPSEVTVTLYGPLGRVEDTFVVPVVPIRTASLNLLRHHCHHSSGPAPRPGLVARRRSKIRVLTVSSPQGRRG